MLGVETFDDESPLHHRATKAEAAKSQANSQALAQLISTNTYLITLASSTFKDDAIRATQSAILSTIQSINVSPVLPSDNAAPANVARVVPGLGEDSCSICRESISMQQSTTRTPCDHWFHHTCIARWISSRANSPTCPVCRQSLSEQFIDVIENFGNDIANREVLDDEDL
jgi:hypothetical protein